jgi:hypothetical protein
MKLKNKVTSSAIPNEKEDSTKNEQRQTLEERAAGKGLERPAADLSTRKHGKF